jgi:hypothetical protein
LVLIQQWCAALEKVHDADTEASARSSHGILSLLTGFSVDLAR